MRSTSFVILAICALFSFSSCTGNNSNDPEPEAKKTFTGCRLIKRVWLPNAALQTNKLEVEYVYDSNNNIVEEKNFSNGNYYGYSVTYTYDLNGKIVASEPYSKAYHYCCGPLGYGRSGARFG